LLSSLLAFSRLRPTKMSMRMFAVAAFTIASERVNAEPWPVWTYWNNYNRDHTVHFHGSWGDETAGDEPTFYAFPYAAPGSIPVHCYWNADDWDHDCHPGGPYPNERKLDDIPFDLFWIMKEPAPFRVPLYVCFNAGDRDHTFHQLPAWPNEHCDNTFVNGYAYEAWPKKIVYHLHMLYSVQGGSSGHIDKTIKYSSGIIQHESHSATQSSKLASQMHAEVGGPIDVFEGKVSADVSASIDAGISDAWEKTTTFNTSESEQIYIDLSKPCYIYQMNVEMVFNSGTVVAGSKVVVQTNTPVSPTSVETIVDIFGPLNEVLV